MSVNGPGAVVLAGGRSKRFGERDKALVRIGDEPMLVRVVDRVGSVTGDVVVSCRRDQRPRFERLAFEADVRFVVDPEPDEGPLAGLAASLPAVEAPLVAVVACDMPGTDPDVLEELRDRIGDREGAVPCLPDGTRQPLQAIYRTDPLRTAVARELESGGRSVRGAVDRLDVRTVSLSAVADPSQSLANVNTPAELDRFRRDTDRWADDG